MHSMFGTCNNTAQFFVNQENNALTRNTSRKGPFLTPHCSEIDVKVLTFINGGIFIYLSFFIVLSVLFANFFAVVSQ